MKKRLYQKGSNFLLFSAPAGTISRTSNLVPSLWNLEFVLWNLIQYAGISYFRPSGNDFSHQQLRPLSGIWNLEFVLWNLIQYAGISYFRPSGNYYTALNIASFNSPWGCTRQHIYHKQSIKELPLPENVKLHPSIPVYLE